MNNVKNITDNALLAWVYLPDYLWLSACVCVCVGGGGRGLSFYWLRGIIISAIHHGIINHYFYIILVVEIPHTS